MSLQRLFWMFVIAVLLFSGVCPGQEAAGAANAPESKTASSPAAPVADSAYVIGPDDILAISVWREPELTRELPVRPDGKISLPLVDDVQAAGLTPAQLQEKLMQSLTKFMKTTPVVAVIVKQPLSQKINVMGAVNRPGMFPLSKSMTVLDALSLAGGLNDFAKKNKIYVLRVGPDGTRTKILFDYTKALKGGTAVELKTHDTVVVP